MNITENFLNKEELSIINNEILENNFPWYVEPNVIGSTGFPFLSHNLINRCDNGEEPIPNSDYYSFFKKIIDRYCKTNNIKFKKLTRACLNLNFCNTKYDFISPHVDHIFKHNVLMIYLKDSSGNTLIFDKNYKNGNTVIDIDLPEIKKLEIAHKIKPEQGKTIMFDGSYFHTYEFCKHNESRVVGVFTFI